MMNICEFRISGTTERTRQTVCFGYMKLNLLCKKTDSVCSGEQCRAIGNPVYSAQISNWLANANFYSVAMGYHVVWFDTALQTLLISSIQFCPSLCITEPSGHLFTNKPLMAQIFRGLSLWHGKNAYIFQLAVTRCLFHIKTRHLQERNSEGWKKNLT